MLNIITIATAMFTIVVAAATTAINAISNGASRTALLNIVMQLRKVITIPSIFSPLTCRE
jgi:hypothetical protein